MALIPLKARSGINALTFAARVAPFVLATAAQAVTVDLPITIGFGDSVEGSVQLLVNGREATAAQKALLIHRQGPEFMELNPIVSKAGGRPNFGGIVFSEPVTKFVSDVLTVDIKGNPDENIPLEVTFSFYSDPPSDNISTTGFLSLPETGQSQDVGIIVATPIPGDGVLLEDRLFRNAAGESLCSLVIPLGHVCLVFASA